MSLRFGDGEEEKLMCWACSNIFVVGAGRGPLVAGCLRAAERARRQIRLTAVEKNPSAFVV